jgi:pimeloyl-ACP methyl ester carboxylesterase
MMVALRQPVLRRLLVALLLACAALGASRPLLAFDSGKGEALVVAQDVAITAFTYHPLGCEAKALLFVFHGLKRKAENIRDNAIPLADRACLLVLAPLFDKERFPNWRYHRAGVVKKGRVQPKERWTRPIVDDLIAWGRQWAGDPAMPYILFGHSAGAQFLSRLSAYSPLADAARIVIANPSVHVLPLLTEAAPYGFGGSFERREAEALLKAYLALPITIYLGDQDAGEKNLVKKPAANRQGANRLERGLTVFRLAWELAKERGWRLNWRLVTVPGVGHSSKGMLTAATAEHALGLADRPPPGALEGELEREHAR